MGSVKRRERTVEFALLLVGLSAIVVAAFAIPRIGIGWDSGMHTYGALDFRQIAGGSNLSEAYDQIFLNIEFYGVLIQWGADLLFSLTGGQGPLSPSSLLTYQLQGILTLCLSVLSASAIGIVITYITKSRVSGLFVWSAMLSLPLLMGYSVMNFKDMPTASGLLLVSAGAALTWVPSNARVLLSTSSLVALGVFVALSVRIGSWLLVAAILAVSIGLRALVQIRTRRSTSVLFPLGSLVGGVVVGLLGVYLLNPLARIDFDGLLWDSFAVSRSFDWVGTVRTFGQDLLSTELPWWYLPVWFSAQMPILLLVFTVVGIGYWLAQAGREVDRIIRPQSAQGDISTETLSLTPFAVQGIAIPVGLVVIGATLYDGIRHVAFAVPALIVLTAPLVKRLLESKNRDDSPPGVLPVIAAVIIMAIPLSSLISSIRWYPYMYAHVNSVAIALEDDRDWEYDYWGTTVVEGVDRLRDLGLDRVVVSPPIDSTGTGEVMAVALAEEIGEDEEYGLYTFRRWYASVPETGCRPVFEISRAGVTLGEGAICQGIESLTELRRNVREP